MICELYCNPRWNKNGFCSEHCFGKCPGVCRDIYLFHGGSLAPSPPPSPPQPIPPRPLPSPSLQDGHHINPNHLLNKGLVISSCFIGVAFIFIILFAIWRQRHPRRRRNSPILFDIQENFHDEDEGPFVDYPIWYINTIGLSLSVIDSITMFEYKKDEGLIDETDCSVCLGEFQEDESLRLLPKCSHAFHVPCIDRWLRSHKNCPLCRAPIISDTESAQVVVVEQISDDVSPREEETREEVSEGTVESGNNQVGEGGSSPNLSPGDNPSDLKFSKTRNGEIRVLSDLVDKRQVSEEEELGAVRRSVSFDSLSASVIYQVMADTIPHQRSESDSQVGDSRNLGSRNVEKHGIGNPNIKSEVGKSTSMERFHMKRSSSSSRKLLFPSKHRRSQSSIFRL